MHASLTHAGDFPRSLLALQHAQAEAINARALLKRERRDRRDLQQCLLTATAALAGLTNQVRLSVVQHSCSVSPMPWLICQNAAGMLSRHSRPDSTGCRSRQVQRCQRPV